MSEQQFRSGVVAVIGRPNVGKSTLINRVVGEKVTIVSNKAQTTRRRILGIANTDDYQIAFVDTPGMHSPHDRLGKALNEVARTSVQDVDLLLIMVDGSQRPGRDEARVADVVKAQQNMEGKRLLVLNKMDKLKPQYVESNYNAYCELFEVEDCIMTSLTKDQNVDILLNTIIQALPEGPPHFDQDSITDQSMRSLAAELIREKVLHLTKEEVPHAVATYIEEWAETDEGLEINAVILVEREGQKGIVIGKKGQMLKEIGTAARKEINEMIGRKAHLNLFVKVRKDWRQSERHLKELDLI